MRPISFASALLMFGWAVSPALGQSQRVYDQNANYRGQLSQEGSKLVVRDQNGNPHGYFQHEGDKTVFYDNNGNRRGYSTPAK